MGGGASRGLRGALGTPNLYSVIYEWPLIQTDHFKRVWVKLCSPLPPLRRHFLAAGIPGSNDLSSPGKEQPFVSLAIDSANFYESMKKTRIIGFLWPFTLDT